jgi:hypothetical protein
VDEAVREVFPDAVAALHRPHPVIELPPGGEQLRIPGAVSAEAALAQHHGAFVDDLDRRGTLMRVHPDDHTHRLPPHRSR